MRQALFFDAGPEPCLTDDETLRFVRGQMDAFEREGAQLHLEDCSNCRAMVEELTVFGRELAEPAAPAVRAAPNLQNVGVRLREAGGSWLQALHAQISGAQQAFRPAATAYGFGSGEPKAVRETIPFGAESAFSGSYAPQNETCRLHIEHASCPPGTLALLEAEDAAQSVAWRRFAVFRAGARRTVFDLTVDCDLSLLVLHCGLIDAARLPNEAGDEITSSYAALRNIPEDAICREAWEDWARAALALPLAPAIREAVASIAAVHSREDLV